MVEIVKKKNSEVGGAGGEGESDLIKFLILKLRVNTHRIRRYFATENKLKVQKKKTYVLR